MDPLSLLPLAIAAGGGRVDDLPARQLVAAGLTLLQRSAALVRALDGRRSAILLPSSPACLTALAASEGRGAVLVNPLAAPGEIAYQLRDANVGAVFTTSALAGTVPEGVARVLLDDVPRTARVVSGGTTRDVDLGSHFGLDLEGEPDTPGSAEEAVIVYTSAMRGTPLGAVLTHRNLVANARSTIQAAQLGPEDHVLAALPWSHLFGLTVTCSAPLMAGARVTTMQRFNPARAVELLAGDVTMLVGVPAMYHALVAALERAAAKPGELRIALCGGAALPLELQARWFDLTGVELRQGYGLTEAAPVCLFNGVDRPNARGTLGVPMPGVEVAICRPLEPGGAGAPEPLPDGQEGEICVRGANVSPGYVSRGEDGLVVHGGWLRTGDLGVRGADGAFRFTGLLKPMFTRSGYNVYPAEVAQVIRAMPGVRDVEVRAIPEPVREHDVGVVVTGDVGEEDVKLWCVERLASYKQPSVIEVRAS